MSILESTIEAQRQSAIYWAHWDVDWQIDEVGRAIEELTRRKKLLADLEARNG